MIKNILTSIYKEFIDEYPSIMSDMGYPIERSVLESINAGDCGATSLAVGYTLTELCGEDVIYVTIQDTFRGHSVIKMGSLYYDAINHEGVNSLEELSYFQDNNIDISQMDIIYEDFQSHFPRWIHHTDTISVDIFSMFRYRLYEVSGL